MNKYLEYLYWRYVEHLLFIHEYIQFNKIFLWCSTVVLGMSGKVVSTYLSKPWWTMCHPHLTLWAWGITFWMALSTCVNSWLSPSVITILILCNICFGMSLGKTTLKTHLNIHDCWLGMNTRRKINMLPFESFPPAVSNGLFSLFVFSVVSIIMTSGNASSMYNSFGLTQAKDIIYFCSSFKFIAILPKFTLFFKLSISCLLKSRIDSIFGSSWSFRYVSEVGSLLNSGSFSNNWKL